MQCASYRPEWREKECLKRDPWFQWEQVDIGEKHQESRVGRRVSNAEILVSQVI